MASDCRPAIEQIRLQAPGFATIVLSRFPSRKRSFAIQLWAGSNRLMFLFAAMAWQRQFVFHGCS
jgi:hypothetical protein